MSEPAFPAVNAVVDLFNGSYAVDSQAGLTKRELFAAMAMQGMMANPDWTDNHQDSIAAYAILLADALIPKLERTDDH